MWVAFIPCIAWALGTAFTARAVAIWGPARVNRMRLLLATIALSLWVVLVSGVQGDVQVWMWFVLSGIIGLGLGDMAMMAAYRFVGMRVSVLLTLCLAVPVCGLGEYVLLGTALSVVQITWMVLLLAGVALVVAPGARFPELHGLRRWPGLMYGALSGISMGVATLISRYAYHLQDSKGGELDGIHAAWQRMLGGLSCMLLLQLIGCLIPARSPAALAGDAMLETDSPSSSPASGEPLPAQGNAWPWMIGSTLLGPIIGIGAYQWALVSVEGAVVQAISSLVPVVVIPVAWVAEGDRPGWRGVVGGVVACGAAVALSSELSFELSLVLLPTSWAEKFNEA